jgi:thioredoxin 1
MRKAEPAGGLPQLPLRRDTAPGAAGELPLAISIRSFIVIVTFFIKGEALMASENVCTFTDDNFEKEVLQSDIPVLVDFWATWCAPCKAIAPLIDSVAAEYEGRIKVGKVNVDDNPATPGKYGVRGIPTVILLKDGKVLDQVVGAIPKSQLEALIKKAL